MAASWVSPLPPPPGDDPPPTTFALRIDSFRLKKQFNDFRLDCQGMFPVSGVRNMFFESTISAVALSSKSISLANLSCLQVVLRFYRRLLRFGRGARFEHRKVESHLSGVPLRHVPLWHVQRLGFLREDSFVLREPEGPPGRLMGEESSHSCSLGMSLCRLGLPNLSPSVQGVGPVFCLRNR